MLINGASFPHKAQRPTEGREIMYAEFTGAVGCCCRAGGHLWSKNDSCIEMRRLPGGYFGRVARSLEMDSCDLQCHDCTFAFTRMRGRVTRQEWSEIVAFCYQTRATYRRSRLQSEMNVNFLGTKSVFFSNCERTVIKYSHTSFYLLDSCLRVSKVKKEAQCSQSIKPESNKPGCPYFLPLTSFNDVKSISSLNI